MTRTRRIELEKIEQTEQQNKKKRNPKKFHR